MFTSFEYKILNNVEKHTGLNNKIVFFYKVTVYLLTVLMSSLYEDYIQIK